MPKPLTIDALHALMAVLPPPPPHHYAMSPDVMTAVLRLGTHDGEPMSDHARAVRALTGVEIREDATLPPGSWEARNRDGSPWRAP